MLAGPFLRRLDAEFVERFDLQRSVEDAGHIAEVVAKGRSLTVFPEGTFVDAPGFLPFHLGAFLAATRAGVPVVPVAVTGTRQLLPASRWWPRRTALRVTVCAPLAPAAVVAAPELFAAAVRLREAALAELLRPVGPCEPMLDAHAQPGSIRHGAHQDLRRLWRFLIRLGGRECDPSALNAAKNAGMSWTVLSRGSPGPCSPI